MGEGRSYAGFGGRVGRTFRSSEPWWPPRPTAPEGAPNVVVVLADDVGFSDFGCYGSEIRTPHIDALADSGVRYANFHVTPMCSPTRAALLTGRNSHAVGVGSVANADPGFPGYVSQLADNQPSLAEVFRANGYATFMVGKWHLSQDSNLHEAGDRRGWPLQRGFDEYYGFLDPLTNFHHPHRLYNGNSVVEVDRYPEGYYLTDDLTDRAVTMILGERAANPRKPFFLYYAHGAVHAPLHAKREDIDRYRGRYDRGWDRLREERLARQEELGIVGRGTRLPARNSEPNEDVPAWDDVPERLRPLFARYMEVYAGMVDSIDQSVGRLVDCLEQLGELDNTLFIVTSDNGASREGNLNGSSHYWRGSTTEPGKRTQDIEDMERDLARIDEIGGPTTWPHYPRGWAMACNTPFRLYKTTTFAGGHQVPLVVSWPGRLEGGSVIRRQYAHVTDLLPTLVDMLGLQPLEARAGQPAEALDGRSLVPSLLDADAPPHHDRQYYECLGNRAFYDDGWEVVTYRIPLTPFSEERWHLFNLVDDPTQIDDLAEDHPDRVKELVDRWEEAAWANRVFPLYEGGGVHYMLRPTWEKALTEPVTLLRDTPTTERFRSNKLIAGRSFRVVVDIEHAEGDEGILVSHGGQESGYVLYVEDGHLRFTENYCGDVLPLDPVPLPAGAHQVTVDVTNPGGGVWHAEVKVDGRTGARREGLPQISVFYFLPFEGINVGIERRSPVLWDLFQRKGCFPYTGTIHRVTYVPGEPAPDAPDRLLEQALSAGAVFE